MLDTGWKNPKVAGPIVVAAIGGVCLLGGAVIQAVGATSAKADPAPVDCAAQYKGVQDILKVNPKARISFPADSPVEKQCHMNDFIQSITTPAAN